MALASLDAAAALVSGSKTWTTLKNLTVADFLGTGNMRAWGEIGKSQKQMAKKEMRGQISEFSTRKGKRWSWQTLSKHCKSLGFKHDYQWEMQ